jgi:hypothetical protein
MSELWHKSRFWPVLSVVTGVSLVLIIWGEERSFWYLAQGALIILILSVTLAAWGWFRLEHKHLHLPAEAATYNRAIRRLLICISIGYSALIIAATRHERWANDTVAKALGYGTLIAGAAFMLGVLLGFLFGFPPSGASQKSVDPSSVKKGNATTNLEEVADWLTKLIIGASLVELGNLRKAIKSLADYVAGSSGSGGSVWEGRSEVALAVMMFFFAGGILYGYLWTRYEYALESEESASRALMEHALAIMGRNKEVGFADDDWSRALNLLTEAIEIRDSAGEQGRRDYELARAVCRIHLDSNFNSQQASDPSQKQAILADLDKGESVPRGTREIIDKDHVVGAWKQRNSLTKL